jgi:adenosine kinase
VGNIVVTGSVAFDHIMDFPGRFKEHILPDKVHMLSVSFLVDNLKKVRGGCAANIAYNLALLGERPKMVATVGDDFAEYRAWLEEHGVDTSGTRVVTGDFTASCFITTDLDDNQITGFYTGAMRAAGSVSLRESLQPGDVAIISPNDPGAMTRYPGECRELGAAWVYDPGQQIVRLSGEDILDGVSGARCVIGNDYEMALIQEKAGRTPEAMLELSETVIVTRGEHGSTIMTRDGEVEIPAAKARRVLDPTGAGDAYRAGVLLGLMRGDPPERYGRVASLAAVYAVEEYGTQAHSYTRAEFAARYREAFGADFE